MYPVPLPHTGHLGKYLLEDVVSEITAGMNGADPSPDVDSVVRPG
ncbi:hypothetical protein [Frankia sp. CiP1_Cm_nod2]